MRLAAFDGRPAPAALLVSAATGEGVGELVAYLDQATRTAGVAARRARQNRAWVEQSLRARFGSEGLAAINARLEEASDLGPFAREQALAALLRARLRGESDPK
jgi:LAO/AO transport system kinase